jgi:prevent-host-death family protein
MEDALKRITAQELQRNIGEAQDMALQEPVAITHHGRERLVLMSIDEYKRLQQRRRKAYAVEELPEWIIDAVEKAEMDPQFDHLDRLMD